MANMTPVTLRGLVLLRTHSSIRPLGEFTVLSTRSQCGRGVV